MTSAVTAMARSMNRFRRPPKGGLLDPDLITRDRSVNTVPALLWSGAGTACRTAARLSAATGADGGTHIGVPWYGCFSKAFIVMGPSLVRMFVPALFQGRGYVGKKGKGGIGTTHSSQVMNPLTA
jgi:hypothetical protein